MATASEISSLTQAYRNEQVRRATLVAALVAAYYRSRLDIEDPGAVERWLQLMVPQILKTSDQTALLATQYATALRRLEVPNAIPHTFEKAAGANAEQVGRSLRVVGPESYLNKMRDIRGRDLDPTMRAALEQKALKDTLTKVTGAAVRHAQSGGRNTLERGAQQDRIAQGYVRVTRDDPCYFCAMLASRGLTFSEDSFDGSDPRFVGPGDAKVHDSCRCTLKPVYDRDSDPFMDRAREFEDQWLEWGIGSGPQAVLNFRRGYEGRAHLIE